MSGHGARGGAPPQRLRIRVYYEDTDFGGVVYHANYLKFMERARTEWLRGLGVDQARLRAETGLGFVVRRMRIEFLRPAMMDDMLEVETRLEREGGASLALAQDIRLAERAAASAEPGALLASAEVQVACVGAQGRAARLPEALKRRLSGA
ncbi:MAG: tol-pal system-associated acyl-CoA thioesterase [Pseudomonadota bacterium]